MTLKDRLILALGGQLPSRATEASRSPEDEPPPSGMHSWGYRSFATDARPFSDLSFHQLVEKAWTLYTTNPLANRIISIRTEYVVDHKSHPEAANRHVQQILDDFWYDPINDMPNFLPQAIRQLLIFGTQVYPVFVNLHKRDSGKVGDGLIRLGYVDPADIADIHLDPTNCRVPIYVETKEQDDPTALIRSQRLRVTHLDLLPQSPTHGLMIGTITDELGTHFDETGTTYDGACFLFRINSLMNSKWGWSDLIPLQVWLDQANFFFTDIVEHIYWLTNFVYSVEIQNAPDQLLKARRNEIRANPPTRGSVLVHNEKEKWNAITPDLRQEDISSASRTLVWWIAGIGAGIPEHWLGWGRETTRATAREMQSPTLHMLQSRQFMAHTMIRNFSRFQIDQAIRAKMIPANIDTSFVVRLPELLPPDISVLTLGLRQVTTALSTPAAQELIPPDTARQLLQLIAKDLAIEFTPIQSTSQEDA